MQNVNNSIATKLCVNLIGKCTNVFEKKGARHHLMIKLCRAWLIKVMHSFEVHSNESACRKSGRLGLEQVTSTNTTSTI